MTRYNKCLRKIELSGSKRLALPALARHRWPPPPARSLSQDTTPWPRLAGLRPARHHSAQAMRCLIGLFGKRERHQRQTQSEREGGREREFEFEFELDSWT